MDDSPSRGVRIGAAAYDPPDGPPRILWSDDALVFVDKPAGLLSVPGKGPALADCLQSRLADRDPDIRLIHRLDRDTSGVMVFARTPAAQRHLGLQFERRHLTKVYVARVSGRPDAASGRVDLPLRADWPNRPRQMVDPAGKSAVTLWERIGPDPDGARLRLRPETGRSHQLRVHMLAIGHPILGDPFYAEGAAAAHPRLMLHAEALTLRHPDGGGEVTVSAAVPF